MEDTSATANVSDCGSVVLGLTDIDVDLVGVGADGTRDVRVLTAPEWLGRCPLCRVVSTRSKGWGDDPAEGCEGRL